MTMFDLIVYGFIQGVAEFLPISSSAHLALLPYFLKIKDPGVTFDLMMHLGTALAVIIYFYRDLFNYCKALPESLSFKKNVSPAAHFTRNLLIATMTTIVMAVFLKDLGATLGRQPIFIIVNLMIFGLYMWWSDKRGIDSLPLLDQKLEAKKSFLIGFAQGLAIFPGVSRSGATIATSRHLGVNREEASRFSFLLSLPIILAGALVKLPETLSGQHTFVLSECLWGILFSFIFGILTISVFMKMIKKIGLVYFTVYRFLLGLVLTYYFFFS